MTSFDARGATTGEDLTKWSRLMACAQAGDVKAYALLLEEVVPYLRSLAGRQLRTVEDIEDAVQDSLLTLHAIRHTYDPRRPFGPWLVTIASRRIVDHLRHASRISAREVPLEPAHETLGPVSANLCERVCEHHRLHQAVAGLPRSQRRAVELLRFKEASLKEAAVESGISVAALKVAGHRALKALRAALVPPHE